MRSFVWISLLCTLASCAYPVRQGYKAMGNKTLVGDEWHSLIKQDEQIFRARISFRERSFGGLMAVKNTDLGYRFAFFTEVGMTMFDIEVGKDSSQLHYCFEPLNRKALLKLLESDFRRLTLNMKNENGRVFTQGEDSFFYKCKPGGDKLFFRSESGRLTEVYHPSIFPDQAKIKVDYMKHEFANINIVHKKIKLLIELEPIGK